MRTINSEYFEKGLPLHMYERTEYKIEKYKRNSEWKRRSKIILSGQILGRRGRIDG